MGLKTLLYLIAFIVLFAATATYYSNIHAANVAAAVSILSQFINHLAIRLKLFLVVFENVQTLKKIEAINYYKTCFESCLRLDNYNKFELLIKRLLNTHRIYLCRGLKELVKPRLSFKVTKRRFI